MSQVRINVTIPAGELEVIVPLHLTMADSGKAQLREALLEASNRVLRAYGKEEIPQVVAPPAAQHWLTENPNADPVCSCGWNPGNDSNISHTRLRLYCVPPGEAHERLMEGG